MRVREVWSGGQTGVDRAALDAATACGLGTGGWVPRGRRAEDGAVPAAYAGLRETPSDDYAERTTRNVRDTDATLILHRGPLTGGSAFTLAEAERLGRPVLAVDLARDAPDAALARIRTWLGTIGGTRLNVAGPRASTDPGVGEVAAAVLRAVFAAEHSPPAAPSRPSAG